MILVFDQIGVDDLGRVGGKGLNLGALSRAGFPVPPGFCVTTEGFAAFIAGCPELAGLYDQLDTLSATDMEGARRLGGAVREALSRAPLPEAVARAALAAWRTLGAEFAYAVRSSATAEDLPGASFAGQQDTYLNIRGEDSLLDAIKRCFISLFTDRAILYRTQNHFGHRAIALSVVVQCMVFPESAGILFTADPVSGHRGTMTIDAGFGLGEALVSGLVNADLYRVDKNSGEIRELRVGDKSLAIRPLPDGGTWTETLDEVQRQTRVLDDGDVAKLRALGLKVEAHYGGCPMDIEWCIESGALYLVQARPITSLYPLVEPRPTDDALHIYFSFSHAQNMTDPISPLGRDLWRAVMPFGKKNLEDIPEGWGIVSEAGGRLYLDLSPILRRPRLRRGLLGLLGEVYPSIATLVASVADRPAAQRAAPIQIGSILQFAKLMWKVPFRLFRQINFGDPEQITVWADALVDEVVGDFHAKVQGGAAGSDKLRRAWSAMAGVFRIIPTLPPKLGAGIISHKRLQRRFAGTPHAADVETLQRGLVGNVTTQMDLVVGDLADLARPYPALIEAIKAVSRGVLPVERLVDKEGGSAFLEKFREFLAAYGVRGQGEIDISRTRWSDEPGLVLSSVIGNLSRPEAGAHRVHFERLQAEAAAAGQRLVAAAGSAGSTVARLVGNVRHGLGVREHPKYILVQCLATVRAIVLEIGAAAVAAGRIDAAADVFLLRYTELSDLADGRLPQARVILAARRADQARFQHMSAPLVVTSEGEIPRLPPPKDLPPGALAGLGASAGVVEGIARVIADPGTEVLHSGEILVAPYTDPGWTLLFVNAAGLVCDVGGMMTHGSVVAREYGIPAVVGVGDGTKRIRTGQRVRVDGDRGIVEIIEDVAAEGRAA